MFPGSFRTLVTQTGFSPSFSPSLARGQIPFVKFSFFLLFIAGSDSGDPPPFPSLQTQPVSKERDSLFPPPPPHTRGWCVFLAQIFPPCFSFSRGFSLHFTFLSSHGRVSFPVRPNSLSISNASPPRTSPPKVWDETSPNDPNRQFP